MRPESPCTPSTIFTSKQSLRIYVHRYLCPYSSEKAFIVRHPYLVVCLFGRDIMAGNFGLVSLFPRSSCEQNLAEATYYTIYYYLARTDPGRLHCAGNQASPTQSQMQDIAGIRTNSRNCAPMVLLRRSQERITFLMRIRTDRR